MVVLTDFDTQDTATCSSTATCECGWTWTQHAIYPVEYSQAEWKSLWVRQAKSLIVAAARHAEEAHGVGPEHVWDKL